MLLIRLRCSCLETRSLLSVVYLFSITDRRNSSLRSSNTTGRAFRKKQDDTRQSSNGLQTRTPPTYVITKLQTNLDLRNTIPPKIIRTVWFPATANFWLYFLLPVSSAVRCRVLCRRTIGAGTSVRLGFPNVRSVVSDGNVT